MYREWKLSVHEGGSRCALTLSNAMKAFAPSGRKLGKTKLNNLEGFFFCFVLFIFLEVIRHTIHTTVKHKSHRAKERESLKEKSKFSWVFSFGAVWETSGRARFFVRGCYGGRMIWRQIPLMSPMPGQPPSLHRDNLHFPVDNKISSKNMHQQIHKSKKKKNKTGSRIINRGKKSCFLQATSWFASVTLPAGVSCKFFCCFPCFAGFKFRCVYTRTGFLPSQSHQNSFPSASCQNTILRPYHDFLHQKVRPCRQYRKIGNSKNGDSVFSIKDMHCRQVLTNL